MEQLIIGTLFLITGFVANYTGLSEVSVMSCLVIANIWFAASSANSVVMKIKYDK